MKLHARQITPWLTRCFIVLVAPVCMLTSAETQIWSEEFNSGSTPDSAVWSYDLGGDGWGNSELQSYTRAEANVKVTNGTLVITAVKQGNSFTSSRIKTEDKLTFKYGTVEARIQVPDLGNALWPAFWIMGNNVSSVGWPDCGEIDVMEMGSRSAIAAGVVNRRVGSTAHWGKNNAHADYGLTLDRPSDLDGSFHNYRMEWTPTAITTYLDEVRIWSIDISNPGASSLTEFHEPHFFILNLAVGGEYTGILDPGGITASFPAEYLIDYIRIFDNGHTILGGSSTVTPPARSKNLITNPEILHNSQTGL